MLLSQEYKEKWSFISKLFFRFIFTYFSLYILLMFSSSLFETLWRWIGSTFLGITYDYSVSGNGSGDNTYAYITLFVNAVLSILICSVWTILDRKRLSYNKLLYWFLIGIRIVLVLTMLLYGFVKIFQIQFPQPSLVRLLEPLGDFSPMGLAWTYMGYSEGFSFFTGIVEVIGGLLLIPRRTQTLGAFIVMGIMTHVAVMNFMFDIPVKLFSTHLVLMATIIWMTDSKRFLYVFVKNKTAERINYFSPITDKTYHKAILFIKSLALVIIVVAACLFGYNVEHSRGHKREKPFLYGIWETSHFIKNKDTIAPLITNSQRWRYLILDYKNEATVKVMTDRNETFQFIVDSTLQKIKMYSRHDTIGDFNFTYEHPNAHFLKLKGTIDKDTLEVILSRKDLNDFRLISRGFHWINEAPYNR